jgi:hypothetical protein
MRIPVCFQMDELSQLLDVISDLTVTVTSHLSSFLCLNDLLFKLCYYKLNLTLLLQEFRYIFVFVADDLASLLQALQYDLALTFDICCQLTVYSNLRRVGSQSLEGCTKSTT